MDKQAELQEKLKALERMFVDRLPGRLQEIASALQACRQDAANTEAVTLLHRELHSIAGTAGTFGFVELGDRARAVEHGLKRMMAAAAAAAGTAQDDADTTRSANWHEVEQFLLFAAPLCAPAPAPAPEPDAVPDLTQDGSLAHDIDLSMPISVDDDADMGSKIVIYLFANEGDATKDLLGQLRYFGFRVQLFDRLPALWSAVQAATPSAVIIESKFDGKLLAEADEIRKLHTATQRPIPVVVLARTGGFDARLAAVRAGADGFFPIPVDVAALCQRLDTLTAHLIESQYRVMTMDDDEVSSAQVQAVLQDAGMEVRAVTNPADILQGLGEYRPELILMDVYMPHCNGIELTQMIRQDNAYLDVPIVFLSSEKDPTKQLAAIQAGADDFLLKPIEGAALAAAITHRAQRYRGLRSLILRDGLTGLYNHSAIREHLTREMSQAKRSHQALSLAVLDLDNFKHVNDAYGHVVGDEVLRALSRLLQQWMRRSDIVGRYGGEEFVVILPGTSVDDAVHVLNNVREAFGKVRHHAENQQFHVTFSAGVSGLHAGLSAEAMVKAADDALYQAKAAGRNRIVRAVESAANSESNS